MMAAGQRTTLSDFAASRRLDEAFLRGLGVEDVPGGGLSIPYFGIDGKKLFCRERDTQKCGEKRFHQPAGVSLQPYGLWKLSEARALRRLYVVEGESDVWTLWKNELPALGIPGSSSAGCLTAAAVEGLDNIYVWKESDQAGKVFVEGITRQLRKLGYAGQARVICSPDAKDPSDLFLLNPDPKAFRNAIGRAALLGETLPGFGPPGSQPSANGHAPRRQEKRFRGWNDGDEIIYTAAQVKTVDVEWLWPWRIALSKLTTFAGLGGLGKTFVLCDIAARVTSGLPWPDCGPNPTEQGQVLFISGEDDPDDTIVPRLIEMKADLSRVNFLKSAVEDAFTLADLDTLEEALKQANARQGYPPVRFIAIDPPTAFLGDKNDHKNSELRGLLRPLKTWAKQWRCAIVFNTHFNKASGQKIDAMMRVIGGVAWVNAVRSGHVFARDLDNPEHRLFVPMKNNLGPERPGLSYRLAFEPGQMARVEWLGEVTTTADDAVNSVKPAQSRGVAASQWLIEQFRQKLEWTSEDLFRAAAEEGVSKNAIFEAKRILNLPKARKTTNLDNSTHWIWWVPADWPPLVESEETPERQQAPGNTAEF